MAVILRNMINSSINSKMDSIKLWNNDLSFILISLLQVKKTGGKKDADKGKAKGGATSSKGRGGGGGRGRGKK